MKLYRYVNEQELQAHLSGDYSTILSTDTSNKPNNDTAYLAFFPNRSSCSHVRDSIHRQSNTSQDSYYFCEFDIPLRIALPGMSYGLYKSPFFIEEPTKLREFKIPVSKLQKKFLTHYARSRRYDKKWTEALNSDIDKDVVNKLDKAITNNLNDITGYEDLLRANLGDIRSNNSEESEDILY
ncbi:MAG: hypothetical protein E7356_01610 [Clostridiales bacterium]|nr:hypothetical protein [Clostridiales bacterium]